MSTTKIAPVPNQSAIGSYQLTAEKALAQIFAPTDLYADRGEPTEEGDATWVKVAALDHVSRVNVVQLFQHLQKRCADEHARPRGVLCPTREAIFNDGMREVMRQVSVLCPERGLLLNDLLQQMAQNTITYDVLAENASQYAVRKSTERDLRRHLFTERSELESEVRRIENRVNELRAKYSGLQKRFEEQKEANLSLREEEVVYIKKANQQIINEIKRLSNLEAATSAA
ncbi:dynein light intermediate chain, axonemal [Angomonas deanei]|uniref:Axonemal dynein light chain, putative n=1 Tax=Angomonas deanei TaxID=59799 RepID=A0A7G2CAB2_9TRYP|nr:dynein light intermediate chain, axonemal [Angomonas deanei]CAD2215807.1 Axonemal dynein light chain, putative [Angomonas deanei]|eukprot:EPY19909.1 dynein light intermediate chain, axonemal [Angomonas deanei]